MAVNKSSILAPSATFIDTVIITYPDTGFPINIPNKSSFILILNIDAKTDDNNNHVVGNDTSTNITILYNTFYF